MKRSLISLLTVATAITLIGSGCGKSIEGEGKKWDRNVAKAQETVVIYPGFGTILAAELAAAEAAMANTDTAADKKARAKQMATANAMLSKGTFGLLRGIESDIKDVQRTIISASSKAMDHNDRMAAEQAADLAKTALAQANALLKKGATDSVTTTALLKRAKGSLEQAKAGLRQVIQSIDRKKKAAVNAARPKPAPKTTTKRAPSTVKAAPAKTKKPWKCKYCGSLSADKVLKCKSCGAGRS
jgi:hypothetical protein